MNEKDGEMRELTEFERFVIEEKGTEQPFTGKYTNHDAKGFYHCKKCDAPLYTSEHKFQSHCGWPSFDDEIPQAVLRVPDKDGLRTEIVCNQCGGHLGHVFMGEMLTTKNIRHCVNSVSLTFKEKQKTDELQKKNDLDFAVLGGGCFWCLEAVFSVLNGVTSVVSGYCGGDPARIDYESVCKGNTGHAEVVKIAFDPRIISYEELLLVFFDVHDPTSLNRQGNDIGTQYRSVIFACDSNQQQIASEMITKINAAKVFEKPLVTELVALGTFFTAENYHQNYYAQNANQNSYCQLVVKPKLEKIKAKYKAILK